MRLAEGGGIGEGRDRAVGWFAGMVCVATGLVCLAVGTKWLALGVAGEWVWPYARNVFWDRLWLPAGHFALLLAVLWVAASREDRDATRREAGVILSLLVGFGLALQLGTASLGSGGFHEDAIVTLVPWTGGYHSEALKAKSLSEYLAAYPDTIRSMSVTGNLAHVSNHPPGYIVFYVAMDRLTQWSTGLTNAVLALAKFLSPVEADVAAGLGIHLTRSQEAGVWLSALTLRVFVTLTLIPVYLLARRTLGHRAGFLAAGFAAIVPGFHLFSPYPDAIIIFLAPLVVLLWDAALDSRPILYGALAGGMFFLTVLCGLAVLVLGPIGLGVWVLRWLAAQERHEVFMRGVLGALMGGCVVFLLGVALWLVTGCNLIRVVYVCFEKHSEFYEVVRRSYWPWVAWNLADLVLFVGLPIVFLTVRRLASISSLRLYDSLCEGRFLFSAFAALLLLDVLGLNRGETGRLWLVFMPFFCLAGAALAGLGRPASGKGGDSLGRSGILVLIAQFVQVCVLKLCLDVFGLLNF